jgi:site-specific DNA-adenine methylase
MSRRANYRGADAPTQRAIIGDLNDRLLNTYEAIRQDWERVAGILDSLVNPKEDYLRIRRVRPDSSTSSSAPPT